MKMKISRYDKIELLLLFLFAIALFNRAGYLFAVVVLMAVIPNLKHIRLSASELILGVFAILFFGFYTLNYGMEGSAIILYLVGPVGAFLVGKLFVQRYDDNRVMILFVVVLALGMFMHGMLNLVTYLRSSYAVTYAHLRLSMDVWRKEIVTVTTTGMLYTFATGISLGVLWTKAPVKYKAAAVLVLAMSIGATMYFANRTLIFIVVMTMLWKGITAAMRRGISGRGKLALFLFIDVLVGVFAVIMLTDLGSGIRQWISSLKIIDRIFVDGDSDPRFWAWMYFFDELRFLQVPFGGRYLLEDTTMNYFHSLWLDTYNYVGIFPFALLVILTVRMIRRYFEFRRYMLKNDGRDVFTVMQCLLFATLLNCMVEPIIEGNPYYFLIILMYLGAMEGKTNQMIRADLAQ